jgi:hypothetical protein
MKDFRKYFFLAVVTVEAGKVERRPETKPLA